MSGITNRPRVFVSSTVIDMRDMRSALKFWLEELGLEVRLSEYNDFEKPPDKGTFEACFASIAECHYYVLLVGGRKGSEYQPGVSVTQKEYRVASELANQGRIIPVLFVRADVKTALRERKDLGLLSVRADAETHATEALKDPEFVAAFVHEIENTEFARRGEDLSGFMWLYRFHDFRDIVDALRVNLSLHGSVPRRTLLANLRWELTVNIAAMCSKHGDTPMTGYRWLDRLRRDMPVSLEGSEAPIRLSLRDATDVLQFLVLGSPQEISLRTTALRDCISSREFLVYDQLTGQLKHSQELEGMYSLLGEIESYQALYRFIQIRLTEILALLYQAKRSSGVGFISPLDLGVIFALYDRLKNTMILSNAFLDYIANPEVSFRKVDLAESSPFGEEERERIEREHVTHDDIENWRKYSITRNLLTGDLQEPEGLGDALDAIRAFPGLHERIRARLREDPEFAFQLMRDVRARVLTEGPEKAAEYYVATLKAKVQDDAAKKAAQ